MIRKPDDNLLASYLSGECSDTEKKEIELWIKSSPENEKLMDSMKSAWAIQKKKYHNWDKRKLWLKIAEGANIYSMEEEPKVETLVSRFQQSQIWKIAAILLLTIALPYFYIKVLHPIFVNQETQQMQEFVVEHGKTARIQLADGSKVTLDAGTSLYFPKKFKGNLREVLLEGEGYFEIAHNPKKPFVVKANNAIIKVLGTKFNVRAWKQSKQVKVAVSEGKVSLKPSINNENNSVVIKKGQLSTLQENGELTMPQNVDINKFIGWLNHEIVFDDAPLSEILDQLERWYNLEFQVPDSTILAEHLTVHIENKPVDDILELISTLTDLKYTRNDSLIILKNDI